MPRIVGDLEILDATGRLTYLLRPHVDLPGALWRIYVVATRSLLGPSNGALVLVGFGLHALCSYLVWRLARRLGTAPRTAAFAAVLHFVAYPGFHAYAWPVGVQHVLTVLFVLLLLDLYLRVEHARGGGAPRSGTYAAALVVAVLASFTRVSSLIGPAALLAHATLAPATPEERRRRVDRWLPVIVAGTLYPLVVLAWGAESEALVDTPLLGRLVAMLLGTFPSPIVLVYELALVLAVLLLLRLALRAPALATLAAMVSGRRPLRIVGTALAVVPGVVALWGIQAVVAPVGLALTSHNTVRWHVMTMPLDVLTLVVAAAVAFAYRRERQPDLLLPAVVLAGFGVTFLTAGERPGRYWIYVTPFLAIATATTIERVAAAVADQRRWPAVRDGMLICSWSIVLVSNVVAVRLEAWRHKLVDTFQTIDYIRVAELIRLDLGPEASRAGIAICVDRLEPLPYESALREAFGVRLSLRDENARGIVAQALGRRSLSGIQLDCAESAWSGALVYAAAPAVQRLGRPVDPFVRLDARLRQLVGAGEYASAAIAGEADPRTGRPFLLRYVLEGCRDDDIGWMTNGRSLLEWYRDIALNADHWGQGPDAKVAFLRRLGEGEITQYIRFVFLREYARARLIAPRQTPEALNEQIALHRAGFRAMRPEEIAAAIRSDPDLAGDPAMMQFLQNVVEASPVRWRREDRFEVGVVQTLPSPAFYRFVWRLL